MPSGGPSESAIQGARHEPHPHRSPHCPPSAASALSVPGSPGAQARLSAASASICLKEYALPVIVNYCAQACASSIRGSVCKCRCRWHQRRRRLWTSGSSGSTARLPGARMQIWIFCVQACSPVIPSPSPRVGARGLQGGPRSRSRGWRLSSIYVAWVVGRSRCRARSWPSVAGGLPANRFSRNVIASVSKGAAASVRQPGVLVERDRHPLLAVLVGERLHVASDHDPVTGTVGVADPEQQRFGRVARRGSHDLLVQDPDEAGIWKMFWYAGLRSCSMVSPGYSLAKELMHSPCTAVVIFLP